MSEKKKKKKKSMGGEDEAETIVKTGASTETKSVFTQKCYICGGFDDDSYECMHVKILCAQWLFLAIREL